MNTVNTRISINTLFKPLFNYLLFISYSLSPTLLTYYLTNFSGLVAKSKEFASLDATYFIFFGLFFLFLFS